MLHFIRVAGAPCLFPVALMFCGGCDAVTTLPTGSPTAVAVPPPQSPNGDIPVWAGERQDEPFDVRQFLASRAAPQDNAAPLYLAALAHISSEIGGDSAKELQAEIHELAELDKLEAGSVPDQRLAEVLAKAAIAIQQIDAAQAKPQCVFVTGLAADSNLSHLQAARTLAKLVVLQLYHARATGDFAAAEAAAKRGLRMSRDVQPRGGTVTHLVSIAMDNSIRTAIERLILNDRRLTAEHCDRLLSLLAEHQSQMLNRLDEGLRVEYIISRNSLHDLETGRLNLKELF